MTSGRRTDAVIVNYNAAGWLGRCVGRLLTQPLGRVIIVDNGSADRSLDEVPDEPRVEVIRNRENRGYAVAANQAVAASRAEYILLCNPDLALDPSDGIPQLESVLDADPRIGVAGIIVRNADGSLQRACRRREPTPLRSMVTMLGLERLGFAGVNVGGPLPASPVALDGVSGAALFVRRACWDELGGFDPGYFLHCEDLDLFRRARDAGWSVVLVPTVSALHGKGISQRRRRRASERDKHRGMIRYYKRFVASDTHPALRWIWPALIGARYRLLSPWWALQDHWASRARGR